MRQILSLLFVASLFVVTAAVAGDPRLVTVSGSGDVLVEPDLASLGIGVEARAPSVDAARRQVNDAVRRVLDLTRASGISQEQVSSAALMVRPDHQWMPESREQKLLGYVVTRRMNIRLTDITMLGEVLEGVLKLGINQVDPPVFDTTRRAEFERQALAAAAKDARQRARVLAQALDMDLGPAHRIEATGGPVVRPVGERVMAASSADDAGSYQTGEIRIGSQVTASFELLGP